MRSAGLGFFLTALPCPHRPLPLHAGVLPPSSPSQEVTSFIDPCMTDGQVELHDSCIDKPTPDNYTCAEQALFDKCYWPFMTSALAAQVRQGTPHHPSVIL